MFVEKCNRYAYNTVVVVRDVDALVYVDRVVVIILGKFFWVIFFIQYQLFVSLIIVKVSKPSHPFHSYVLIALIINSIASRIQWIVIGNSKLTISAVNAGSKPHL